MEGVGLKSVGDGGTSVDRAVYGGGWTVGLWTAGVSVW